MIKNDLCADLYKMIRHHNLKDGDYHYDYDGNYDGYYGATIEDSQQTL